MAATREQIVVQQLTGLGSIAYNPGNNNFRMTHVWTPLGRQSDRWALWLLRDHQPAYTDGVYPCLDVWWAAAATFRAGAYYFFGDGAVSAPSDANPAGYWVSTATKAECRTMWTTNANADTRPMVLTVPAGTTEVWIAASGISGFGTFTITASGGTVVANPRTGTGVWDTDTNDGNDFLLYTNAFPWKSWKKVASNFAAEGTVTLTPSGDGRVRLWGWLSMTAAASMPDVGVYDPASMVSVMPDASQNALGPLQIGIDVGTPNWLGQGHWDSAYTNNLGTITGEAETVVYGSSLTAWAPAADSTVTVLTNGFSAILSGTVDVGAGSLATVAAYTRLLSFTPDGLYIEERYVWSEDGADNALKISADHGGYCGQWSLNKDTFSQFRFLPYDAVTRTIVAPWDNSNIGLVVANEVAAYGSGLVATLRSVSETRVAGTGVCYNPASVSFITKRSDPACAKIYHYSRKNSYAAHNVGAGDVTSHRQWRTITDRGGLEPATSRRSV